MKILINKFNLLKNLNLDRKIEESSTIINAAKDYYSPHEADVQIDGDLVTIDLSKYQNSIGNNETLIETDSLGFVKLEQAIPILERLLENDSSNSECYADLFNAYDLRGDFNQVIEKFFAAK